MKNKYLVLLVGMFLMLFVGCGGDEDNSASTTVETDSGTQKPLTILFGQSGFPLEREKEFLALYTQETGQEFEVISVAYNDLEKKLSTMIRGGEPPAIVKGTTIHSTRFRDYFIPLDYDTSTLFPYFFYNSEGENIGVPVEITATGLFINTDLADKYGVNYPTSTDDVWTWEEFEFELRKMLGKDDVDFPFVMDGSAHRFSPYIYQNGGLTYNGSYSDSGWDEPEALEALERIIRFDKEGLIDTQTYSLATPGNTLFSSGRYGVYFAGSWLIDEFNSNLNFNYTPTYLPVGPGGRFTSVGGYNYHVFKDSGQEEAALKFIDWLAKPENLAKMSGTINQLGAATTVDVDYGDLTDHFKFFQEELAATSDEYVEDFLKFSTIPGAFVYTKDAIIESLGGLKTPEQALKDAAKALEESAKDAGLED